MTDKERLEEIKEIYRWAIENSIANRIADSDIEWLINRVKELELEINDWRAEVQKFYEESEESHLETKELLKSIVNQNKRYRKVLEEIARDRLPVSSYKARQALGWEEKNDKHRA